MKIAWFTPFARRSAIGRYSQAVTNAIAKDAEVDLWLADRNNLLDTALPIFEYDPALPLDRWWLHGQYDFAVCHLGDHLGNHRKIYEFSRRVPSIIVLHDYVMHHFLASYATSVLHDAESHHRKVEQRYGDSAREANALARAGKAPWICGSERVVDFPMFEDCLCGALGVVVHSDYLARHVAGAFSGPLRKIHLAYEPQSALSILSKRELNLPENKLLLLTVGQVNANKRVRSVIQCLADHPDLASQVHYRICGDIEPSYRAELEVLIHCLGLSGTVRLNGHTSDIDVRSCFHWADVCINLRFPAMEGASASLAELMSYGKPGIVTDTGIYAEIPDDCVLKVRPDHEAEDLSRALRLLIESADLRKKLGVAAQRFARENFNPATYAHDMLAFLKEVQEVQPVLAMLNRTSSILSEMGVQSGMEIVRTVAEMSKELFCGDTSGAPWNKKSSID